MGQFSDAAKRFVRWRNKRRRREKLLAVIEKNKSGNRFHNGGNIAVDTYFKESVRPNWATNFSFGPQHGDDD